MQKNYRARSRRPAQVVDDVRAIVDVALKHASSQVRDKLSGGEIANVLRTGNEFERSAMANLAGDLRLSEFEHELVEIVLRDPSPCVRHEAAYALGQIGSPRVFELLTNLASSDERLIVRHEATLALAGFQSAAAEKRLTNLKHDSVREIRDSATVALLQIEHESAGAVSRAKS
jgi:HEAT repeats